MERKVYRVCTQYVFEGVFEVVATDRAEAERKIFEDCGMVMGYAPRLHIRLQNRLQTIFLEN